RLGGARYAAPDPAARSGFDAQYTAANGSPAPGLADFAYDAGAIARVLAQGRDFSAASLCRPEGYAGVDGVLALLPDGTVRRGLVAETLRQAARENGSGLAGAAMAPLLPPMERVALGIERLSRSLASRAARIEELSRSSEVIVERLPDPLLVLDADRSLSRANA